MSASHWWLIAMIFAWSCIVFSIAHRLRLHLRQRLFQRAKREFRWQRERLEAKFVQICQQRAESSLRRWVDCDFGDDVTFVRNRINGKLMAFVSTAVTIEVPFADLDASKFINQLLPSFPPKATRTATVVFVYNKTHWDTDGRFIFNLSPSETIRFYRRGMQEV